MISAPVILAFTAGMVAAFNPCGFAMLPAYMGLYMGSADDDAQQRSLLGGLGKAVLIGGTVTAGFIVLFAGCSVTMPFSIWKCFRVASSRSVSHAATMSPSCGWSTGSRR